MVWCAEARLRLVNRRTSQHRLRKEQRRCRRTCAEYTSKSLVPVHTDLQSNDAQPWCYYDRYQFVRPPSAFPLHWNWRGTPRLSGIPGVPVVSWIAGEFYDWFTDITQVIPTRCGADSSWTLSALDVPPMTPEQWLGDTALLVKILPAFVLCYVENILWSLAFLLFVQRRWVWAGDLCLVSFDICRSIIIRVLSMQHSIVKLGLDHCSPSYLSTQKELWNNVECRICSKSPQFLPHPRLPRF